MWSSCKKVAGEEMDNFLHYTNGLFNNFAGKLCSVIFVLFGFHVAGIHGDIILFSLLIKLMVADFIMGIIRALKTKTWDYHLLIRGICKFPLYALYIFIIACVDQLIYKSTGLDDGWCVKLFLAYLIVCEAYSIIRSLGKMGVKVPYLLEYLSGRLKSIIEHKGKNSIDKVIGTDDIKAKEKDKENE